MGYIKKVVDTGVEFAENYKMPEYVAKARGSSKIIDVASEKIENFYCAKGSPVLKMIDELTAEKINTALAVANTKVEQAQTLKTAAAAKVQAKKTEAIEMAKQTKATAYDKTIKTKEQGLEKYNELKIFSAKKVDETKTIMRKRVIYASEEACKLEEKLEKKLKEKAETNEYANKVLSCVMTAKMQVKIYGEALVKKSLALPLTLQERMDKGLSFAKDQVKIGSEAFQVKKAKFVSFTKKSYETMATYKYSEKALSAVEKLFCDKAATFSKEKLLELKKANVYGKISEKMTSMYKYSACQVGKVAEKADELEGKYVGTSLVSKALKKAGK
jgi:hypothetical protein